MDALAELVESLPVAVVATDPATVESYRFDWSRDLGAGTPLAASVWRIGLMGHHTRPDAVLLVPAVLADVLGRA